MRPESARQLINNTIQHYLNNKTADIYNPVMIRALNKMYCKQVIWHKNRGYDFSSMYDYTPDLTINYNSIKNEMFYISDRWNSPQRLQWLITGIENKLF